MGRGKRASSKKKKGKNKRNSSNSKTTTAQSQQPLDHNRHVANENGDPPSDHGAPLPLSSTLSSSVHTCSSATATATATATTRTMLNSMPRNRNRGRNNDSTGTRNSGSNMPMSSSSPASLEYLPPNILYQIVNGLDEDDKDNLFRVVTHQQDSNVAIEREDDDEDEEEEQDDNVANDEKESKHPDQVETDVHHDTNCGSGKHETTANNNNPPLQQQQQQGARVPVEFVVADPDTLLDRLNTRRLRKRLVHGDEYTYPPNMTTDEIAQLEWKHILLRATQQQQQKGQQRGRRTKEEDNNNNLPPLIPPSRELLMFTPCPRSVAVLASYPRSGNSLMRSLYEKITLRVSGSDMRGGLVSHDLVGEAAISANRVQFCKTHYPERRGISEFPTSRVVLLVRNPYDALDSFFNLMTTGTHTTTVNEEMRSKLQSIWTTMVQKEVQVWQAFNEFWLQQDIPLLLVRYEDLIRFPYEVMCRVIKFVLEISNMDFFATRIARCVAEETIEQLGSYQPRSGGIGKSLPKYSPELLQHINMGIFDTMEQLDYTSMLIPNKDEWELEPLHDYAREYYNNPEKTVLVNDESLPLVRTPRHRTNWAKLKREMNGMSTEEACLCAKCMGRGR